MSDIVVPGAGVVVAETPPPQPSPEVVAAAGETIVEVAQIEAARDVAIAEEGTEQTRIMAEAREAREAEDVEWLRQQLAGLQAQCETNAAELSNVRAALLTTQEQLQQTVEQVAVLTEAMTVAIQAEQTPEPGSPPLPPEDASADGPEEAAQGERTPPVNPERLVPRRKKVWL